MQQRSPLRIIFVFFFAPDGEKLCCFKRIKRSNFITTFYEFFKPLFSQTYTFVTLMREARAKLFYDAKAVEKKRNRYLRSCPPEVECIVGRARASFLKNLIINASKKSAPRSWGRKSRCERNKFRYLYIFFNLNLFVLWTFLYVYTRGNFRCRIIFHSYVYLFRAAERKNSKILFSLHA